MIYFPFCVLFSFLKNFSICFVFLHFIAHTYFYGVYATDLFIARKIILETVGSRKKDAVRYPQDGRIMMNKYLLMPFIRQHKLWK